jgi:tripartite-type tricarboxylate transporter receptor subunit TctC
MKRIASLVGCIAALGLGAAPAIAQTYPSRPIHVIVPTPPGTVTDLAIRAMGNELSQRMGQIWIVDNKVGPNQSGGMEQCGHAKPDGYTLCAASTISMSFNVYTLPDLAYDPNKDFTPVTPLWYLVEGLIATGTAPIANAADLKAYALKKGAKANFATLGTGTGPDIARQWLNERWGTQFVNIPYKGAVEIIKSLYNGETDAAWIGAGNMGGDLGAGHAKIVAVNGDKRSPLVPNAPTLNEIGLTGFPLHAWWGLFGPAGIPQPILAKLEQEIGAVFRGPTFSTFLARNFLEGAAGSSEDLRVLATADRKKIGELVETYHIPRQ